MMSTASFAQVQLKTLLVPGVHKHEQITKVAQTLSIAGMETKSASESIVTSKQTIGKRGEDGKVKSEASVAKMQLSIKAAGSEYMFDSANPDQKGTSALEVLRTAHQAIMKAKTVTTFDKKNRVEKVEFDQGLLEGIPDQIKALVKTQTDGEYLKQVANAELDRVPAKPVKKGDSWNVTETVDFGGGQLMTFETKYTYAGVDAAKKMDKITSKVEKIDFEIKNSPLPITLKSHELKPKESSGEFYFDRKAGRFMSSKSKLVVAGKLTFEANGVELPAELDLTMESEGSRSQ